MGDISINTHQPNSGDTHTELITHQESPSDLSGPTIDDSMPSGKENKQKKIAIFMPLTKIINNSINTSFFLQMLGTGTIRDTTEQPEHATLQGQGDLPPQSNLPESLQLQSHLPSLQQLEQDGYDSDSGIDHNVAINGEGPLEVDEPDIPEVGASSSASTGVSDKQNAGNIVNIPEEQLKKLKVVELKSELAKR